MNKTQGSRAPRETEPLPKTVKPALLFLLFLAGVVATMAIAAYAVDRMIYGIILWQRQWTIVASPAPAVKKTWR